jgi:diacylglycerol kinase
MNQPSRMDQPIGRGAGGGDAGPPPFDDAPPPFRSLAGRRSLTDKLGAGLSGWKHALRGDSSFFAHAYRALLVALTAALLGVRPEGWIALVLAGGLIFIAETNHSAVDTLARAVGDPEEPRLKVAREIAAGGVLAAVVAAVAVVTTIFVLKFGELLSPRG